jgi:soluble lytic murein transglycosylase
MPLPTETRVLRIRDAQGRKGRCWTRALSIVMLLVPLLACNLPVLSPTVPTPATTTPTQSPAPSPTPSPTPLPADLLRMAEEALFVGDADAAVLAFQAVLSAAPDDTTAAEALLGLGHTYLQDGAYGDAAAVLGELLARFPTSPLAHDARFLLAEGLMAAGDPLAATDQYLAYLDGETAIAAYIQERLGDALRSAADDSAAAAAYQVAVDTAPDPSFERTVREKLALALVAQEDYEAALTQYDAILAQPNARIAHQAAQTLLLAGRSEEAYARHLAILEDYPTSAWAYESLVVLVEAGVAVDDLTRGIVDYYGGAYGPSVTALYRYIDAHPVTHSGDAHYFAGLAHLAAGSPALAEGQFRVLVETHPENARWGDGWMGWAQSLTALDDVAGAVETYRAFAAAVPDHSRAPEALWTAAQLLESSGELEEAAGAYEECQATYPLSDYASAALLRGGLQHYQLGAAGSAAADWQALGETYPTSEYRAASFLWLGRAFLAMGQPLSATVAFSQAVQAEPTGYYGLRAADLLADPLAPPFPPADYAPPAGTPADQVQAEEWLASWLGLASTENLGDLDPTLETDGRLQRGLELWRLGLRDQARTELEALRRATAEDPLAQYRLALLFRDIGLYRSSILAASNLIGLSPAPTPLDAPPFLTRLAYPLYYDGLVSSNALSDDLPPLLLFALIRQESLFEGFATSYAYAHGLMQVIPSTGDYIAGQLGWPADYETADLYRPIVSVRFGTWYLARQRDRFDGRLDVALAAYNGGPGNAERWLEAAGADTDLFLERITLGEPRLYLQRIREHYAVYSALYGQHELP